MGQNIHCDHRRNDAVAHPRLLGEMTDGYSDEPRRRAKRQKQDEVDEWMRRLAGVRLAHPGMYTAIRAVREAPTRSRGYAPLDPRKGQCPLTLAWFVRFAVEPQGLSQTVLDRHL